MHHVSWGSLDFGGQRSGSAWSDDEGYPAMPVEDDRKQVQGNAGGMRDEKGERSIKVQTNLPQRPTRPQEAAIGGQSNATTFIIAPSPQQFPVLLLARDPDLVTNGVMLRMNYSEHLRFGSDLTSSSPQVAATNAGCFLNSRHNTNTTDHRQGRHSEPTNETPKRTSPSTRRKWS